MIKALALVVAAITTLSLPVAASAQYRMRVPGYRTFSANRTHSSARAAQRAPVRRAIARERARCLRAGGTWTGRRCR